MQTFLQMAKTATENDLPEPEQTLKEYIRSRINEPGTNL